MRRYILFIIILALVTPVSAQDDEVPCNTLYADLTPAQEMVVDEQYNRIEELGIIAGLSSLDMDFVHDLQDWSVRAEYMDRRLAETKLPDCSAYMTMDAAYDDLITTTFKVSGLIAVIVDLDSRGRDIPDRYVEMLEAMLDEMADAITDWTIGSVIIEQDE